MVDASGKLPSGVLEGTLADLGSFDECLEADGERPFPSRYCLLDARPAFSRNIPLDSQPPPGIRPSDLVWHESLRLFWASNDLLAFRYGACAPAACAREDLQQLAHALLSPIGMSARVHSCQVAGESEAPDATQLAIASVPSYP